MGRRFEPTVKPQVGAVYCRVSSKRQSEEDKVSLETQEAEARAWYAARGIPVSEDHVWREVFSGEEYWRRPLLQEMLEAAERNNFCMVLFHSVDRMSREKKGTHLALITERLDRAGVRYDFVTEKLKDTPEGRMMLAMRQYAAGIENERRRERTTRARRGRAQRGQLIICSGAPYGYQWPEDRRPDGKLARERLIPHPVKWDIMVRIWNEAFEGRTLRRISARLMAEGILTPGGKRRWEQATITTLLKNGIYWGEGKQMKSRSVPVEPELAHLHKKRTRREPIPDEEQIPIDSSLAPPMVSKQIAEAVHARLLWNQQHSTRNNIRPFESLLRGHVWCGDCGGKVSVNHINGGKNGARRSRYSCRQAHRVNGWHLPHYIEVHLLDRAAWERICRELKDPRRIREELEKMRAEPEPGAKTFAAIDSRVKKLSHKIDNLAAEIAEIDNSDVRAILREKMEQAAEAKRGLEAEREAGRRHLAEWRDRKDGLGHTLALCARVARHLDGANYDERRMVLHALQVRVTLHSTGGARRVSMSMQLPVSGEIPLGDDDIAINPSSAPSPGRTSARGWRACGPTTS
jgi:site-specific DNA recombinase